MDEIRVQKNRRSRLKKIRKLFGRKEKLKSGWINNFNRLEIIGGGWRKDRSRVEGTLEASVTEIRKGEGGKTRGSTKMSVTPGENNCGSVAAVPSITSLKAWSRARLLITRA